MLKTKPDTRKYQVEIYDTTLRDGAQQEGISLSVQDKLSMVKRLDRFGVPFIEGGYAGANPKEDEFFRKVRSLDLNNSVVTAFGNTRRTGVRPEDDLTLRALLSAETQVVTLVGKASDFQALKILEISIEENLDIVSDSVKFIRSKGRRVFFDAEHFFDGFQSSKQYALSVLRTAFDAGAERIVLCDTNGGTLPHDIARITDEVRAALPQAVLGIHAHNDSEMAVAGSIAAVKSGAYQVQGCVNGYGERTGNANLVSVIANLQIKMGIKCIPDANLSSLTSLSNFTAELVNRNLSPFQPFVGASAFTHKGGLHAAAIEKSPESYQHLPPELVGNTNSVTISELSGRRNVERRIRELGLERDLGAADAKKIVQHIKMQEAKGFSYESAHASFELVARRLVPNYKPPFQLVDFNVDVRAGSDGAATCRADVKVQVGDIVELNAGEGNGPVAAMDSALRKSLLKFYPDLSTVRLADFKVRVVNEGEGTSACVRVVVESADSQNVWTTVGASENVLEASWNALADSLEWWLVKHLSNGEKVIKQGDGYA